MLIANSPLASLYDAFLNLKLTVAVGDLAIDKPLLLWINDGLMAMFFFLIGLEVKREVLDGELRKPSQIVLPGCAALGGFIVPAAIYAYINWDDPIALARLGDSRRHRHRVRAGRSVDARKSRADFAQAVSPSLAIFDDIAAIVVIALFYAYGVVGPFVVAGAHRRRGAVRC